MNKNYAIEFLKDFYFCRMDCCGCGLPQDTLQLLMNIIQAFDGRFDTKSEDEFNAEILNAFKWDEKDIYSLRSVNSGIFQFILHQLDNAGVITHGSSIYGSRLSSYGKDLVRSFNLCMDCLDDIFI